MTFGVFRGFGVWNQKWLTAQGLRVQALWYLVCSQLLDPVVWPGLGSSDEIRLWFVVGGWFFGVGVSLSVSWVVGRPDPWIRSSSVRCGCEAVGCRVIV
jgi:hypothetical protein